jgi:hypothetical protein
MADDRLLVQRDPDQVQPARTWVLAILTALYCLIVIFLFAVSQISTESSLWPFPGLYFLEIILLASLGLISLAKNSPPGAHIWTSLPWIGAGGLLSFVILGAWTIGFFLIPPMFLSIGVGVIEDRRKKDNLPLHVILFLTAAFIQAAIVLLILSVNLS